MVGLVLGGTLAAIGLRELNYPVVGETLYWLAILGFLAVWKWSPVQLFDERDTAMERRASHRTLTLLVPMFVVGASVSRLATWLGWFTVPAVVWGALYGFLVVYAVFGLAYLQERRRS
jgi:hypothetical protein